MRLTADNVHAVLMDCLYRTEEITDGQTPPDAVLVEGILCKFALNPQRLEAHRADVAEMLAELPDQFKETGGGGWSFLNACVTASGEQWGEHRDMDALFVLGMGLGLAKSQLPREMWDVLPGGMPYYSVAA